MPLHNKLYTAILGVPEQISISGFAPYQEIFENSKTRILSDPEIFENFNIRIRSDPQIFDNS